MTCRLTLDGRHGQARWKDAAGRPVTRGGRLSFLAGVVADGLIAGTIEPGTVEVRLRATDRWHALTLSPDEAAARFESSPLSRGRARRARAMRARRLAAGKPVAGVLS